MNLEKKKKKPKTIMKKSMKVLGATTRYKIDL